jgi:predicted Zn-dependent protease
VRAFPLRLPTILALIGLLLAPAPALAQSAVLIRDTEIEHTLAAYAGPLLEAAGLPADGVELYIIKDPRINAFVTPGMRMFVHTGLLMRAEHPGQIAGVFAHEIGHIAGGHLTRIPDAVERATLEMLASAVLGVAAAVAGAPGLGTAIIAGGQSYAGAGLSRFSIGQEQAADQAAITYLGRAGISPRGLAELLRILDNQSALNVSRQSPYVQSHPLTRDRLQFVESRAAGRDRLEGIPEAWLDAHARMVAKFDAFLNEPRDVVRRFERDDSLPGRYARAIALFRLADLARALPEIDALIVEHPEDPYFHELKGQMLFENGRVAEAVAPYREAVRLLPDAALLRIGLARALIETGDAGGVREAVGHLEDAVQDEASNAGAWRLLGIARGRDGQEGGAAIALAESALLTGKRDDARLYARRAEARLDAGHPSWLRLQDILRELDDS